MYINEAESVVTLVQCDVVGLIGNLVGDAEVCIVVEHNGRGLSGGSGRSSLPLGDALLRGNLVKEPLGRFKLGGREDDTDVCTVEVDARD